MTIPRYRDEFTALAEVARDLAARRQRDYPALVDAGRMDADVAAIGLIVADSIAADWSTISGLPAEAETRSRRHRIATLEAAHRRCLRLAEQAAARVTGRALGYLRLTGREMILADIHAGIIAGEAADMLKPWANADRYAELVGTLLWWEHQYGFPECLLGAAERQSSRAA